MCKIQNDILMFGFILLMVLMLIVFPAIFNCKIIPRLEKKIGCKLKFDALPAYYLLPKSWSPLWWWCEVSSYIFFSYFWKIPKRMRNFALAKVNFDVSQASRFDIIMSTFGTVIVYGCAVFMSYGFFITEFYPHC
jgi:hypothetical protein